MTQASTDRGKPLPRSLYADTARPPVETPSLDGDCSTDVAIVGGGYTGLSTALHLAERGIRAVVLERHEPGWGASGRNGGQVNPGLYPTPATVVADFGEDLGRRMLHYAADAPNRVFELVARHGIDCEASQTGTLRMAINGAGIARAQTYFQEWRKLVGAAEWLDRGAAASASGTDRYPGGLFFAQGGKVNPLGYARGLAETAMKAGARIHGASPALAVERAGPRWAVRTPSGAVLAERLVLATNGYTDGLWPKLAQSIVPVYTTIVATAPLPQGIASKILPGGSVLYETGNTTIYYRLDRGGRLIIGGRSPMRDVTGFGDAQHLIAYAERLWPELNGMSWTHVWNGQVAITPDHHIHMHEPAPNVHIALGYNGRGIAMATAMGALLAQRIAGAGPEELPMPVTDIKAIPLHGLWKPATSLRLAYGRIRDRLGL
ncbi:NAD(P)/FAD-dependent oxidoreductase [Rhodoligotrophos ferricapiens]|uniref:NAD(P)/FAD-dependent oxidoreductase n=1 Tax=Rhodoligotrophos ferricapiens TaxID=3069264 RepID=UPI00315D5C93